MLGFRVYRFVVDDIGSFSQVKSSVQRSIRGKIIEQYPMLGDAMDKIVPKKQPMVIAKLQPHIQIVVLDGEPVFYQQRDGPWMPTLRLLHQCNGHC
jgi:PUA domain protein